MTFVPMLPRLRNSLWNISFISCLLLVHLLGITTTSPSLALADPNRNLIPALPPEFPHFTHYQPVSNWDYQLGCNSSELWNDEIYGSLLPGPCAGNGSTRTPGVKFSTPNHTLCVIMLSMGVHCLKYGTSTTPINSATHPGKNQRIAQQGAQSHPTRTCIEAKVEDQLFHSNTQAVSIVPMQKCDMLYHPPFLSLDDPFFPLRTLPVGRKIVYTFFGFNAGCIVGQHDYIACYDQRDNHNHGFILNSKDFNQVF